MIIKKSIITKGLSKNITSILKIIDRVFYEHGNHMIISLYNTERIVHLSEHSTGNAIDIKEPLLNQIATFYKLKAALGINYRVTSYETHFHVAFEPGAMPLRKNKQNKKDTQISCFQ